MRYGALLPTCEIGSDPVAIRDWAQAAESLGYSHIIVYDHVLGAERENRPTPLFGPYSEHDPFHEPLVLLGYLAGVTTTIGLMTGVLVLPQRQTVLAAKQAIELAVLSQGRFRLGVGTGWNWVEYEALGASFAKRGRMLDEQVALLRKLWADEVVDYAGAFHRVDRAKLLPQAPAPIPLWFGGRSPAAIARAAAHGDGFLFSPGAAEPIKALCRTLTAALDAAGRRAGFGIDALIGFGEGPAHWQREARAWSALGADSLSMRAQSIGSAMLGEKAPGFTKPEQHIEALGEFMREVGR
jgi:probable F420-dependent oxidoreductase